MIWASCKFNGADLGYLPVLNPGACRGRTWLIEFIGDVPIRVVVEAESVSQAIEVLSNDPDFGQGFHFVHVQDDDFPEKRFHQMPFTQRVRIHGREGNDYPYPVRYHDEGFPAQGIDPRQYAVACLN
jgi:hypothetical protein